MSVPTGGNRRNERQHSAVTRDVCTRSHDNGSAILDDVAGQDDARAM
jgi:hypothetical protein